MHKRIMLIAQYHPHMASHYYKLCHLSFSAATCRAISTTACPSCRCQAPAISSSNSRATLPRPTNNRRCRCPALTTPTTTGTRSSPRTARALPVTSTGWPPTPTSPTVAAPRQTSPAAAAAAGPAAAAATAQEAQSSVIQRLRHCRTPRAAASGRATSART